MVTLVEWLSQAENRGGRGRRAADRAAQPGSQAARAGVAAQAAQIARRATASAVSAPGELSAAVRRPVAAPQNESREQLLNRLLDPTLTLEETAQILNVCTTTVRRYTNRGDLAHFRTSGNQRRFRLSEVLAFMRANHANALPLDPLHDELQSRLREGEASQ